MHPDGLTPGAPVSVAGVEYAGAGRATVAAAALGGEIPRGELVPVAADERRAAAVAIGALPRAVVDIAGVHVTQARLDRIFSVCGGVGGVSSIFQSG